MKELKADVSEELQVHSLYVKVNERTNERTNEQKNKRTNEREKEKKTLFKCQWY